MKVIVCPDSFKGTMNAPTAARAIRGGVLRAVPDAEVTMLPLGDGGEGTADALVSALRRHQPVERIVADALDPLGRPIQAGYYIVGGDTAVIESASASGITLVASEERDIMRSDTRGTGMLIADAYNRGIRHFQICMGGTATCDGGAGALAVMEEAAIRDADFVLLCDVDNPFIGESGAAAVFGPQKGATPQMIPLLEERMLALADCFREKGGMDIRDERYAGAAGVLSGMLIACYCSRPVSGIVKVLELLDFGMNLDGAALVITGEGRADATTLQGKAPSGVLAEAGRKDVPVALIAGAVSGRDALQKAGFRCVEQATPSGVDPNEDPEHYLSKAAERVMLNIR